MLMRSYGRRKRYEAQLIAQEVGKVINRMFGGEEEKPKTKKAIPGTSKRRKAKTSSGGEVVSAPAFLRVMGVKEP